MVANSRNKHYRVLDPSSQEIEDSPGKGTEMQFKHVRAESSHVDMEVWRVGYQIKIQQQYSQSKSPKVFTLSTGIKPNHQCLKVHVSKRLFTSTAASQNDVHYSLVEIKTDWLRLALLLIGAAETSRNITAHVIERDVNGENHYFLEEYRGFRTRQHGHQIGRKLDRQK
ncbi:hypothetical protein TNCV_1460471 [Trichonephila clavipes]|nr:hypothetical protein TNCV_1460471 [Trichonephila clavipes]